MLGLGALVALAAAARPATARPMNLDDPTPRWVEMSIEVSPRDEPGRLNAAWTPRLAAWFQPADRPGWRVVAMPAENVERFLALVGDPKPGSFGEFVWVFDVATGNVVSAHLSGVLRTHLQWGFFGGDVEAQVRAELGTEQVVGFRRPRWFLGQRLYHVCFPGDTDDCTLVQPVPYQRETGYVNAVGVLVARGEGTTARTFCSLGEAHFFERETGPVPAVASAPPP